MTAIPIRGQVIIKDTVLISAGQTSKPQGSVLSPTAADWQLPYRGRLKFNWCISQNLATFTASDYFQVVSPFERNFQGPSHWDACQTTHEDQYTTAETYPAGATVSVKLRKTGWDSIPGIFALGSNWVTLRWIYQSWPGWSYILLNITVLRDTVVGLTRPDSAVVYPHYPGRNDTVTVGMTKRFIDLELRTEYAGTAIPNYWVRLDTPVLVDSGGHSHNGARPMGRYVVPKLDGAGVDTITSGVRKTDSVGVLRFKFLASQFGGVERIRARLLSDTTKFDTLSVKTRVPGLDSLTAGVNYIKVGGTCRHHGPSDNSDVPAACRTPERNHWGSPSLIASILAIADSFAHYYPNYRLRINDMSLPLGGGFDIFGRWEDDISVPLCWDTTILRGHCEHREGLNADIGFTVRNPSNQNVGLSPKQKEKLRRIIERAVRKPKVHKDHYHIW